MTFYPVLLNLRGRRAVVIGGGAVAVQKVRGLRDAGAAVTVIAPEASAGLEELAELGGVEIMWREYRAGDLEGAFLAIAATDDRAVNRQVWEEAERCGIPLNAVDDLPHCSFIAPSVHRQGAVTVAVSTGGKSPALAVRLRERIAALVGPEYGALADLLGSLREEIAARVPDPATRTRLWYQIVGDAHLLDAVRRGDTVGAARRVTTVVSGEAPKASQGHVYLVGAGPGDPGLITVRGLELLRGAEVVVYDRLVHPHLLERSRADAERIYVGKDTRCHGTPQPQINDLLVGLARAGRTVVRLKGGDPFVFGRGAEECEALQKAGVPFTVVPGISSALAVPAAAGIPVTHRRFSSGFAVVTGHECDGESDLDWSALARVPTLVVLMGLRTLANITARLLSEGCASDVPAAVVANGTLPDQRVVVATLATIADLVQASNLEPPATLIVGEVVRVRGILAGNADVVLPAAEPLLVGDSL
ncbi:MAG: uroporphyrinogen-III C-methyltransferase [Gemmatimonadetes bacterium]|nr:uroporphyrinogen-III C-methyltransferase [Gemmatimonadota bacterium]